MDENGRWSIRRLEAAYALMEEERQILEDAWPRPGFQLKEDMVQAFEPICFGDFSIRLKSFVHI